MIQMVLLLDKNSKMNMSIFNTVSLAQSLLFQPVCPCFLLSREKQLHTIYFPLKSIGFPPSLALPPHPIAPLF